MRGPRPLVAALVLASVLASDSCGNKGSKDVVAPTDTTPPTVTATVPVDAATGVSIATQITATFAEEIEANTLTAASFTLVSGAPVNGAVTLSADHRTAIFTPAGSVALTGNATFTATLTTAVKDLAGNALASNKTWTFTTAVNSTPTANAGPDQNVGYNSTVTLNGGASNDSEGQSLTFTWRKVAGPNLPGGEVLTGVSPSFSAPDSFALYEFDLSVSDGSSISTTDRVQVWAMEGASGIFVRTSGDDSRPGTRDQPKKTIAAALLATRGTDKDIFLAAGTYVENVALEAGVSLYGGFNATSWSRDPALNVTIVAPSSGSSVSGTLESTGIRLDGLTLQGVNASPGGNSGYAVFLRESHDVTVFGCTIMAGSGSNGAEGTAGASGRSGGTGVAASGRTSGAGGIGRPNAGGSGGQPGTGTTGHGSAGTGGAGDAGGTGGRGGSLCFPNCDASQGAPGNAGGNGVPAAHGFGGSPFGAIGTTGTYLPADGANGGEGTDGSGGGGGGGAMGSTGDGGCGGGGGGERGLGGRGGRGGGASIGVVLYATVGIRIQNCTIETKAGGAGGRGGNAGGGGQGGNAAAKIGTGGAGGPGADGGSGGHGGGGGGGPSIGILGDSSTLRTTLDSITFRLGGGGNGGVSLGFSGQVGQALGTKLLGK